MDVAKELEENHTILEVMPSVEYNDKIVSNIKSVNQKTVCYVTLNKTFQSLVEIFNKKKIDMKNVFFVDAISNTIKKVESSTDNCYYCSSPGALTELSLVINKFLDHKFDYLVFDSITNLAIYQDKKPILKFLSSIVNKTKESGTKSIFYAISLKEQEDLIKESGIFVDKVVQKESK